MLLKVGLEAKVSLVLSMLSVESLRFQEPPWGLDVCIPSRAHRTLLDFQPLWSVLSTVCGVLVFLIV
jgi:hypothetical protein